MGNHCLEVLSKPMKKLGWGVGMQAAGRARMGLTLLPLSPLPQPRLYGFKIHSAVVENKINGSVLGACILGIRNVEESVVG